MGTTVCGLLFDGINGWRWPTSATRCAYRLRDGQFQRITRDHSWVQTLVDDGRIEAEALVHPHRSLILKVLNGQPTHTPDLEMADAAGDRYLIHRRPVRMVTDAAIGEVIGGDDLEQVVDDLVKIAHAEGAPTTSRSFWPTWSTTARLQNHEPGAAEIDLDVAADDIDATPGSPPAHGPTRAPRRRPLNWPATSPPPRAAAVLG
ncbi:MAG: hypothetical protein R2742_04880 [Micropruina glycogenica]